MDKYSSWKRATEQFYAAEHFLNVTYHSLQEPKLFIGIIYNIFSSLEAGMDTILSHYKVPKTSFLEKVKEMEKRK